MDRPRGRVVCGQGRDVLEGGQQEGRARPGWASGAVSIVLGPWGCPPVLHPVSSDLCHLPRLVLTLGESQCSSGFPKQAVTTVCPALSPHGRQGGGLLLPHTLCLPPPSLCVSRPAFPAAAGWAVLLEPSVVQQPDVDRIPRLPLGSLSRVLQSIGDACWGHRMAGQHWCPICQPVAASGALVAHPNASRALRLGFCSF